MSGQRDASFRQVVKDSVKEVLRELNAVSMHSDEFDAHSLSIVILRRLHDRGLAIHDPVNCIRRPWQDREKPQRTSGPTTLGRDMTPEEMIATGFLTVSDDVPDAT